MTITKLNTRLWYGVGEVSQGAKNYAFQLLLLYYYNQVLGLNASLVGIILLLALVFDAITDPLVGAFSDSLQTRWGRRHSLMYVATLPLGLAFYFVFAPPPDLNETQLAAWLFCWVIVTRGAMTLYYVPHMALGAELSSDYHDRTRIVAIRILFGLLGAILLVSAARVLFLPPTPAYPAGQSNPAGYGPLGAWTGGLMSLAIVASALGTQDRIPYLKQSTGSHVFSPAQVARDTALALRNQSFRAFFLGMLLYTVGRGLELSLWMYVGTFFFELGTNAQLVPLAGLFGVLVGTLLWPRFPMEKRSMFIGGMLGYVLLTGGLPLCKLLGLFPPRDSALYEPLIFITMFIATIMVAGPSIASASMVADVVDEHELQTGQRQEGVFFGALAFALKASSGIGNLLGSLLLTAIAFPTQVKAVASVSESKLLLLALAYGPLVMVIVLSGLWVVRGYRLNSERHAEVLHALTHRPIE